MCLLTLMLLVNCHKQGTRRLWKLSGKQGTQCLRRLSGLEGIWEINLHCRRRGGSARGGESPKLAAAAITMSRGLGMDLEENS